MFWLQNYTFYVKEKNNHAKSLADKRKSSTFAADFDLKEVIGAGTGADSYYYKPLKDGLMNVCSGLAHREIGQHIIYYYVRINKERPAITGLRLGTV
jgi:hypothetical protein